MQAKITNPKGYSCAPDGHTVVTFACGEVVSGSVAQWAVGAGDADEMKAPAKLEAKVVTPPEKKAKGKRK